MFLSSGHWLYQGPDESNQHLPTCFSNVPFHTMLLNLRPPMWSLCFRFSFQNSVSISNLSRSSQMNCPPRRPRLIILTIFLKEHKSWSWPTSSLLRQPAAANIPLSIPFSKKLTVCNFPLDLKDQLSYTNKIGGKTIVLYFYLPTFLIAEEKTEDPEPNNIYRIQSILFFSVNKILC